jgi:hypothetical protein
MTREEPSLETLRLQNIETMNKVQRIDRGKDSWVHTNTQSEAVPVTIYGRKLYNRR